MLLTVQERIVAVGLLNPEGDMFWLRAKRALTEKVGLSADEILEYEVKTNDGMVGWNTEKEKDKDVELSEGELVLFVEALKELERTKKLRDEHFSLYEKLVEGENNG